MSNLTQHRTRIRKRYNYSKGSLEKGMIVEMTYKRRKKKGDASSLETKKYMVMVLNSNFRGFMHGISLENISSTKLNDIASDWGLVNVGRGSAFVTQGILTGLRIPKIQMVESSGRFYSSRFKKSRSLYDSYRTYDIANIGSVAVVDYEWDKPIFIQSFKDVIEAQKLEAELETKKEQEEKKKEAELKAKKPTNK